MCHKYTTHLKSYICWLCFWRFVLSEQETFCHKPECDCAHIRKRPEVLSASSHFVKCSVQNALYEMQFNVLPSFTAPDYLTEVVCTANCLTIYVCILKQPQHRFWTSDGDRVGLGNPNRDDACIFISAISGQYIWPECVGDLKGFLGIFSIF